MELPKKINPCPLIDAVVELRFVPEQPAEAVFGILFSRLKDSFPEFQKLPILQLPESIRNADPVLKFKPYYRISNKTYVVQIGPDVLAISSPDNYVGWDSLFETILSIWKAVDDLKVIKKAVRIGVRFINYFDFDVYSKINMQITMNNSDLESDNKSIRAEIGRGDFRNIVNITNKARVEVKGELFEGSIIDIDTVYDHELSGIDECIKVLSRAHDAEKFIFFSILDKSFIEELSPQY